MWHYGNGPCILIPQ